MPTLPFFFIPRWTDGRPGNAILFLPDIAANPGNIVCYQHLGQHSEAPMSYYRSTRRARSNAFERHELRKLIDEYKRFMDKSEHMEMKRRDSYRFQKTRWNLT